jgi:hypothetical protein
MLECFLFHLFHIFRYGPGDVLLFESAKIFHEILEWEPEEMEEGDQCTPGRIGNVFFTPKWTMDKLQGHEEGWGRKTVYGRLPWLN